jgi:hypothetical protein
MAFDDTRHVPVPTVSIFVDAAEWDRRAADLGGSTNSLLAGFCAKLAESMGRLAGDGMVPFIIPINDRADGDTRANAVHLATQLLPLIPFVPRKAVRRGAEMAFGFSEHPVSCSNMGDVRPEIARLDGSESEYVLMRGVDQHVTRRVLEQRHGLLTIVSARVGGRVSLAVVGYAAAICDTVPALRRLVERTLSEFELAGVVV